MEVTRTARKHNIRLGSTICSRTNERVEQNVGNRDEAGNSIPPTYGWADGTNEPRVRAILKVLCGI